MTQNVQSQGHLKPHTIWQDGHLPEPCTVVIFGATGDLAQRKILPTLAHLMHDHPTPQSFCIVAFARRPLSDEQWRTMVLSSLDKYMPDDDKLDNKGQKDFAQHLYYCQSTFDDRQGYEKLSDLLDKLDNEHGTG